MAPRGMSALAHKRPPLDFHDSAAEGRPDAGTSGLVVKNAPKMRSHSLREDQRLNRRCISEGSIAFFVAGGPVRTP
jgi:hypothetical protein